MDVTNRCTSELLSHFPNQIIGHNNFQLTYQQTLNLSEKTDRSYIEEQSLSTRESLGSCCPQTQMCFDSAIAYNRDQIQSFNRTVHHHNDLPTLPIYPSSIPRCMTNCHHSDQRLSIGASCTTSSINGMSSMSASDNINLHCIPPVLLPNLSSKSSASFQNNLIEGIKSHLPELNSSENYRTDTRSSQPSGHELQTTQINNIRIRPSQVTNVVVQESNVETKNISNDEVDINSRQESKGENENTRLTKSSSLPTLVNSDNQNDNDGNQISVIKSNRVVFCTVCRKGYGSAESLNNHMLTHGPHKCPACGKLFSRQCNLKIHMVVHAERTYTCQECGKSFKSVNSLQTHKNTVHVSAENGSVVCDTCGIILKNRKSLLQHEQMHTLGKRFGCDLCGEKFHRKDALNRHVVRIHVEEKFFTCQVCNMHFNTNDGLQDHLWMHESERPHQCKCCKRRFPQRSGLDRHLKTHVDHRPFTCGVCSMSFTRSYRLKTHMQRHTVVKNQNQAMA